MDISALKGKTLTSITGLFADSEDVIFTDGTQTWRMWHSQDCCENVRIQDVCGEVDALIGHPILEAEESTNHDNPPQYPESWTWTFYILSTIKGSVTIRWLGESNGYYGEEVDFAEVKPA